MDTLFLNGSDPFALDRACILLRQGDVVAFPTETVYGLGAHAIDTNAVKKIYQAKGRPSDNPLIVHIGEKDQLSDLVTNISPQAQKLIAMFWPGALTLIFPKKPHIPHITTGGLETVAVRMPNHDLALHILRQTKLPLAAPSANLSGRPSPTNAQHVFEDMNGRIPAIVDGGPTRHGLESTVIDMTASIPTILRPGAITYDMIHHILQEDIVMETSSSDTPRAPGMKYTHYAPTIPIVLLEGPPLWIDQKIKKIVQENVDDVISLFSPRKITFPDISQTFYMGDTPEIMAARLFSLLRSVEKTPTTLLIIEGIPENGVGTALMNRLRKAAHTIYTI